MVRMVLVKSASKSGAADTAQYISGMAKELRSLATNAELGFLAYLLSMVEQEAANLAGARESGASNKKSGTG